MKRRRCARESLLAGVGELRGPDGAVLTASQAARRGDPWPRSDWRAADGLLDQDTRRGYNTLASRLGI